MDQAISYARRMTRQELLEVEYAAGRRRYDDDPLARLLTGAILSGNPDVTNTDRQFAHVMLHGALQAYAKERSRLAGQEMFNYEVDPSLILAKKLYIRNGLEYFNSSEEFIKTSEGQASEEDINAFALPEGAGSVIIVDSSDYIARPETLDIRFFVGTAPNFGKTPRATPPSATIKSVPSVSTPRDQGRTSSITGASYPFPPTSPKNWPPGSWR